jgi:hypothetical protein
MSDTASVFGADSNVAAPVGLGPTAAVGAALGWLVGLGALAMASGVFIVAGPVMAVLARVGGAVPEPSRRP